LQKKGLSSDGKETMKKAIKRMAEKILRKRATKTAKKMPVKKKKEFRKILLDMRERMSAQINSLKGDSLQRCDTTNLEEDGTDVFERQFALTLASSEQDSLFEIDDALRRIDEGTYGICEECKKPIEKPRLKTLPFVRLCIRCQSEIEKGRQKFRPADTIA